MSVCSKDTVDIEGVLGIALVDGGAGGRWFAFLKVERDVDGRIWG